MSFSYTHLQTEASATWTAVHNLNCIPVVDVLINIDGLLQKVIPASTQHVDANTMVVTFSSPQSGEARLVGLFSRAGSAGAGSIDPGSP